MFSYWKVCGAALRSLSLIWAGTHWYILYHSFRSKGEFGVPHLISAQRMFCYKAGMLCYIAQTRPQLASELPERAREREREECGVVDISGNFIEHGISSTATASQLIHVPYGKVVCYARVGCRNAPLPKYNELLYTSCVCCALVAISTTHCVVSTFACGTGLFVGSQFVWGYTLWSADSIATLV